MRAGAACLWHGVGRSSEGRPCCARDRDAEEPVERGRNCSEDRGGTDHVTAKQVTAGQVTVWARTNLYGGFLARGSCQSMCRWTA